MVETCCSAMTFATGQIRLHSLGKGCCPFVLEADSRHASPLSRRHALWRQRSEGQGLLGAQGCLRELGDVGPSLDTSAMDERIGFAGDWHGNVAWATSRLRAFGAVGVSTVYQVGDFGLWPGSSGKRFLRSVDSTCERSDVRLFIVLGNHEDYDRVKLMRTDDAGWLYLKDYPRLARSPRGGTRGSMLPGRASLRSEVPDPSIGTSVARA